MLCLAYRLLQSQHVIKLALVTGSLAVAVVASDWISGAFPLRRHIEILPASHWNALVPVANQVDTRIDQACREQNLAPLGQTDDLLIARRLTLSLHGRIPSLAEIRELEQSDDRTKLQEFADRLLRDQRFGEHVGEVLTRSIVTNDDYDFPNPYRRVSFHRWLSNELNRNTPYDEIVRRIVAEDGLCCEHGSTNFFTAYKCDPALLAAQTARSFLALRLDCAQCHNHPFAEWKQEQFHGLASYYSGVTQSKWQVYGDWRPYEYENHDKHLRERIAPKPPIRPDLDPGVGEPRARLAAWITHRENPYFSRAIVNSMWAMLFGRGLVEPLDDLSKPQSVPGVLDLLANDLVAHQFDLKHLLRVIVATQAFGRASSFDQPSTAEHESLLCEFSIDALAAKRYELGVEPNRGRHAAGRVGEHLEPVGFDLAV